MRVLVYEHLTASGLPDEPSLLAEGAAMFHAVMADLARVPGVEPVPVQARSGLFSLAESCEAAVIIAPEFDDILASIAYWFENSRCRLLGPCGDTVRLTGDKFALAEHLHRAGVPTPPPALLSGVVVKPRFGCGCQDTFVLGGEFIVQPHVPGTPASVLFLDGLPLRPCTQNIARHQGRLSYQGGSVPLAPELEERAVALARRATAPIPGLAGFYGVDLVLGEADAVLEINPRLTTSYVGLRALCRNNLMAVLLGRDASPLSWRPGSVSFTPDGQTTYREAP